MKNVVVLSGAGMSAESGINTFRGADGLWENHDIMEVASPDGWIRDPELVLNFYNQRRRQLHEVNPNKGHRALVDLEKTFNLHVLTQNIDDLHERAGSTNVTHIHGELLKARSTVDPGLRYDWPGDIRLGDKCERGSQLRPDVVWFGEAVPMMESAARIVHEADIAIIVGTSMQVYPAAGLIAYAPAHCQVYYVDPKPSINHELMLRERLEVIRETAASGVPALVSKLLDHV